MGFFNKIRKRVAEKTETFTSKFRDGLAKTSKSFTGKIEELVFRSKKIDEEFYEELEEILIASDVGVTTVMELVDELREEVKANKITDPTELRPLLSEKLIQLLKREDDDTHLNYNSEGLTVYLFVGVNGVGKTTSIGKFAHQLKREGHKVLLAAGDTFRAGAIDQLQVWGERVGVDVIRHQEGADPAAVIYDAIQAAKSREIDILLCDTAGRLQNKVNLMNELNKIYRVIEREVPGAPHEVLLVLDATTGQNAINQAKTFKETAGVTGIVLTKLDGTAKGGIVIAIRNELDIPVKFVGLGEGVDDLQPFDAEQFISALFEPSVEKDEADK